MVKPARTTEWILWGTLVLTITAIVGLFLVSQVQPRAAEEDATVWLNYPLPDFVLTNQDGRSVTLADLHGYVWIGDIVFTRCLGPCPIMTKRLSELQAELPKGQKVKMVTLTTDPENDTPNVMNSFGRQFNADFNNWMFLTGDKAQIARLAVDGMKLIAVEKKPGERENPQDLFIHSTRFVVVDKNGIMRASFDSTDADAKTKVLKVARKLLRE